MPIVMNPTSYKNSKEVKNLFKRHSDYKGFCIVIFSDGACYEASTCLVNLESSKLRNLRDYKPSFRICAITRYTLIYHSKELTRLYSKTNKGTILLKAKIKKLKHLAKEDWGMTNCGITLLSGKHIETTSRRDRTTCTRCLKRSLKTLSPEQLADLLQRR